MFCLKNPGKYIFWLKNNEFSSDFSWFLKNLYRYSRLQQNWRARPPPPRNGLPKIVILDLTLDSYISLSSWSWKKFLVPGDIYASRSVHFRGVSSGSVTLTLWYPIEDWRVSILKKSDLGCRFRGAGVPPILLQPRLVEYAQQLELLLLDRLTAGSGKVTQVHLLRY